MHAVTKNLQSVRDQARFEDFLCEVNALSYDVLFVSETWRDAHEEMFKTTRGDKLFFSGGSRGQGVGICMSKTWQTDVRNISFHAYSPRVCLLRCCKGTRKFAFVAVYFPTSWDSDDAVEEVYDVLSLVLDNCIRDDAVIVLGGDFNASLGHLQAGDEPSMGVCGLGQRNIRGITLASWALSYGLQFSNRFADPIFGADSWTCRRSMDGERVQMDFILTSSILQVVHTQADWALPIGLDHRCVHSMYNCPRQGDRASVSDRD